ncbi:hypothetical protein [Demequina maris]|uniref:hypothetical protein n=1 Tax=Demequina maris TaxID=1638982 RepID=UPI000781C20F|nr:hypothetical protein [Demequina maris]
MSLVDTAARQSADRVERKAASPVDWRSLVFYVAAAIVGAVHAMLAVLAFTRSPVDVDEGFNLVVVRNIADGVGYMSDGVYTADVPTDFEAAITTGPTMLVPAAALHAMGLDLVVAGRVVGLVFYVLLLVGLGLMGRRIAGRWGALAAVVSPLLLDLYRNDNSPVYGPGDLLGEYATAAFAVFAILAARRRPFWAGMLLGLALVTKIVALFLAPAVAVAVWWAWFGAPLRSRAGALARMVVGALVPLTVYEFSKFVVLGSHDYASLFAGYFAKIEEERLPTQMLDEKLATLLSSWFVPAFLVLVVSAVLLCASTAVITVRAAQDRATLLASLRTWPVGLVVSSVVAAIGTVAVWGYLTFTDPTWIRHPAPGLIIGAGGVCAATVALVTRILAEPSRGVRRAGVAIAGLCAATAGAAIVAHETSASDAQRFMTISHQQEIADAIVDSGASSVQGIWGPIEPLSALSGVPASSLWSGVDPRALMVIDKYERGQMAATGSVLADVLCGERVLVSQVVLCWPAADAQERLDGVTVADPVTGDASDG